VTTEKSLHYKVDNATNRNEVTIIGWFVLLIVRSLGFGMTCLCYVISRECNDREISPFSKLINRQVANDISYYFWLVFFTFGEMFS